MQDITVSDYQCLYYFGLENYEKSQIETRSNCSKEQRSITVTLILSDVTFSPELSTDRMDPRVGSGQVGSQFCRNLAGRVSTSDFPVFY